MDLTDSIAPTSEQLDAVDLLGGPRTFTITEALAGNAEQPVNIVLAEFPRVWRPGKSMRRVLVKAWGPDTSVYVGRRVTLYCDETVRFGSDLVGGTRIKAMTDLPGGKRLSVPLLISRGKSAMFTVEPLAESAQTKPARAPTPAPVDAWERDADAPPEPLSDHTRRQMFAELTKHGITDPATQRAGMSKILGREVKSRADLTEDDGRAIVLDLMGRPVPDVAPDDAEGGAA